MPRYIIKIHDDKLNKDYYLEWSTVVDAPVTRGFSLLEFIEYYQEEYGKKGIETLLERLKRVEKKGCSSYDNRETFEELLKGNRAGEKESCATKEEILNRYCHSVVILGEESEQGIQKT